MCVRNNYVHQPLQYVVLFLSGYSLQIDVLSVEGRPAVNETTTTTTNVCSQLHSCDVFCTCGLDLMIDVWAWPKYSEDVPAYQNWGF